MNILTFDIEEWFHITFDGQAPHLRTNNFEHRLDVILYPLLDLLDEHQIKATFLCLGWIGKRFPHLVKEIFSRGHDIGSHTQDHYLLHSLTPKEFKLDLSESLSTLEDIIGEKIDTFRAPAFSITRNNLWVFEILVQNGIKYDLSVFPSNRDYGGLISHGLYSPYTVKTQSGTIHEFPMNPKKLPLKHNIVFTGGGYFRLLPEQLINSWAKSSDYNMFYFHARDFDYYQPRLNLPPIRYFKSYYGLRTSWSKFESLILKHKFLTVKEAASNIDWSAVNTVEID